MPYLKELGKYFFEHKLDLTMPPQTFDYLGKLTDVTSATKPSWQERLSEKLLGTFPKVARIIQDSLRTLEWVMLQQLKGRTIVALAPEERDYIFNHPEYSGRSETLASYIPPDKMEEARTLLVHQS